MTAGFLTLIIVISVLALTPLLLPLLRSQAEDEQARAARRQRDALAAARAADVLSQAEYDSKLAALPAPHTPALRPATPLALALVVLVPLAALLIYRGVGDPRALDPAAMTPRDETSTPTPDLASAVAGLEQRLAATPDDAEGLRLLARGYQSMQRFAEARDTMARVRALLPDDLDVQVEYAESLALSGTTRLIDGEARALIADALAKDPNQERALWLAGISAAQHDDKVQALEYWQRLLTLLPADSEVHASVSEQIRALGGETAAPEANSVATATPAAPAAPADAAANTNAISVNVRVADALIDRVAASDTVFVFARAAVGPKMPLAIQRFAASELPKALTLDDSMGMLPTLKLSQQSSIVIGARISKSGNAIPQPGDLEILTAPLMRSTITAPVDLELSTLVK